MNEVSGYGSVTALIDGDCLSVRLYATEPLVQYLKKGTSDGWMPNWATSAKKPIIYPSAMSQLEAKRKPVISNSESWSYNGTGMTFNTSGVSISPAVVAGVFQKVAYNNGDFDVPGLKIIGNLASPTNVDSDRIGMSFKVEIGGIQVPATDTIDIRLEETVGDPYQGQINATDGGVIDNNTPSVTLTAELMKGGNYVNSGITYKWYKAILGGWETILAQPSTPDKISRTAADIDTYSIIKCEFWISGIMVFAATIQISDETDPYIIATGANGATALPIGGSVTFNPKVVKRASGQVDTSFTRFTFTTYNGVDELVQLPSSQVTATSIKIYRSDVDNASGEIKIFFLATKQ